MRRKTTHGAALSYMLSCGRPTTTSNYTAPSHTKLFFVHADSGERQSNRHHHVLTLSALTIDNSRRWRQLSSLTTAHNVSSLLASCSSLLYALRVLRSHGLSNHSLKDVFQATVIGKLIYCAPAWHGSRSTSDYVRLDSFMRCGVKLGYAGQSATVTDMFFEADDALFRKILYNKTRPPLIRIW